MTDRTNWSPQLAGRQQLSITTHTEATAIVVRLAGEADLATVPQLRAALSTALTGPVKPTEVRVDLAAASFIDAAGVGVLVEGREKARRAGVGFSVRNPSGVVHRVLDILNLTKALQVEPTRRRPPPVRPSGSSPS